MRILARLVLAALLLTSLGACHARTVTVDGRSYTVDEAARVELEAARAKAAAGDYVRAAEMFEDLAHRYHDSDEADEALWGAGSAWERAGQPLKARAAYEELLQSYPRSDKAALAKDRVAALGGNRDQALAQARAQYESLPDGQKFDAAVRNAQQAEAAGNGIEAFFWRSEAVNRADASRRAGAEGELQKLLEKLSPLDVEKLAQGLDPNSFAAPRVAWQMTRIHQQRRDWEKLEASLSDFLARWPQDPHAVEAREQLALVQKRGQAEAMKVGVVLPLTGQYRAYGLQLKAGIEHALRNSGVKLVVRDSRGEANEAAGQLEALVYEDRVIAVIGGVLTAEADAAAVKADELGVPFVSFSRSEGFTGNSEWVFRDMLTNSAIADALVDFAVQGRGMHDFAVLHPQLPYGNEMLQLFWERVEEKGGKVRKVESYAPETTTFSEPIRKLVGANGVANREEYLRRVREIQAKGYDAKTQKKLIDRARSGSPVIDFDALFVPDQWKTVTLIAPALAFEDVITNWCDTRDIERIEKTTGHRVKPVMMLGGNLWNHPELPTRGGKYVNCSVFVDGFHAGTTRPETARFVQAFQAESGRAPGLLEAYGAEAASVVRAVIETAHPQDARAFQEALAGANGIVGPLGPVRVNEEREILHPLFFLTVDRGQIREADPTRADGAL